MRNFGYSNAFCIAGFLFCLLVFCPFLIFSQIKLNQDMDFVTLNDNAAVKAMYSTEDADLKAILQADFQQPYDSSFLPKPDTALWLTFEVVNTDSLSKAYYVLSWEAHYTVYSEADSGWRIRRNGFMVPQKYRDNKEKRYLLPIPLEAFKVTRVYIRLEASDYVNPYHYPVLCSELRYYKILHEDHVYNKTGTTFTLIYLSGLVMIAFFILILYISIRQRAYIYYLFYLLFQIVYCSMIFARTPLKFLNISFYSPELTYMLVEGVQFLFIGFYIFFIWKLLEIDRHHKVLSRILKALGWFCFAYAVFNATYSYLFPDPAVLFKMLTAVRLVILPLNFILICWVVWKVRHPLIGYFIAGNLFFFAGSVASVYVSITGLNNDPESIFYFGNSLNTLFQMGLLGEVLCFSFAIAHHVRLIYQEKQRSAAAYIRQLQENQRIQETMNKELDRKVNEKTTELIRVYSDMEKQREKEIKGEFTQKIREMELLALRAQMNPHFLFNSMNSIKHLIHTGRTTDAMHYLDDFSSLLRGVLQNSKGETVTVEDELEILELYLSLEKGRLGEDLNYAITVEDKDVLSQYPIPALLLQPFVENAIWHGLRPSSKSDKSLKIHFSTGDRLVITIEDNGIGRKMAAEARATGDWRKSFGGRITQERLALFNHLNELKISLEITDLEEEGLALGTRVIFTYSN